MTRYRDLKLQYAVQVWVTQSTHRPDEQGADRVKAVLPPGHYKGSHRQGCANSSKQHIERRHDEAPRAQLWQASLEMLQVVARNRPATHNSVQKFTRQGFVILAIRNA